MKIEIDLDIPEEYEFDGFRICHRGELYFNVYSRRVETMTFQERKRFAVKKKTTYITDVKIGEKFKFKNGTNSDIIYTRVTFENDSLSDINRTKLFIINDNCIRQYHGVFDFCRDGSYTVNEHYKTKTYEVEIIKD